MNERMRVYRTVVALLLSGLLLGAATTAVGAAGESELRIEATDATVATGETTTVAVAAEGLSDGVGSVKLAVDVSDPSVLNVSDVTVPGDPEMQRIDTAGETVVVTAIGLDRAGPNATLARLTVNGTAAGQAALSLTVDALGDRDGDAYTVTLKTETTEVRVGDQSTDELNATVTSAVNNVDSPVGLAVDASGFGPPVESVAVERPDGTTVTLPESCLSSTAGRCSAFAPTESTWTTSGYDTAEFVVRVSGPDGARAVDTVSTSVYIAGDATGDGRVDILDAVAVGRAWQTTRGEPGYSSAADLTNDGTVNILDAVVIGRHWQAQAGAG